MTIKEMKKEIIEAYKGVPEQQIETGRFLSKVGYKYVQVLDIWHETTVEFWPIDTFYAKYIAGEYVSPAELDFVKVK